MTRDVICFDGNVPVVAGKPYPWAQAQRDGTDLADLVYRRRGFHLMFENGWSLSVQWGSGNYCINHDSWHPDDTFFEESPDAEIGALFRGNLVELWGDDNVRGWVPAAEVRTLIDAMGDWPSDPDAVRALLAQE